MATKRQPAGGFPQPPDDVDARALDPAVRRELAALPPPTVELVARHLVAAGRFIDDDPHRALAHALAARSLAARVGAVREATGLAAYAIGRWQQALTELRAAYRMSGDPSGLPVMADCERALGRPEQALRLARSPDVARLEPQGRVEMLIVASGARRDLGQPEAAVAVLQVPELEPPTVRPWTARLWYAYAEALLAAGRTESARRWFAATAEIDEGATDAAGRIGVLDQSS